MLRKRIIAIFLLGVFCATVLSGCGDKKQEEDPNIDNPRSSERVVGGEVVVGISQDLGDSLDPYQLTAAGTREVLFNVYEGLIKPTKDAEFIPAIAKSLPKVSEDGLQYTFTLRDDVKFHNGNVVTADDVIKSFETCAANTVDSALKAALSTVKVEATDEKTVVVKLSEPNGDFLSYVASLYIVPADYEESATKPVGTGPFQFVSRSVQDNLVLKRFADYWGEGAYLDKVTFRIYEDSTALMSALSAGVLDMAIHLSATQTDTVLSSGEYKSVEGTMNLVQALYLNNAIEPLSNETVRKALCYAVDVDEILALTADGHGAKLGTSIYPSFGKYFDESLTKLYPHDIEKAKALLNEAGYSNGFSMTITVPSNYTPHVITAEVLAEQLKQVGIEVKIDQVEWETWINNVYMNREFQSTVIGFDSISLNPGALLSRWVSTDDNNMISYNNPEYDKLIAKAKVTVDDAERIGLYKDAAKLLATTAANVYIQDLADFVVMKKNLDGYEFYPLYLMDMSTVYQVK